MVQNYFPPRFRKAALLGAFFGLLLFAVNLSLDLLVLHSHDLPHWTVYLSDVCTGAVAVLLFMRVFIAQATREANTGARLRTIAEMNHHIRNALQVISYWAREERDDAQVRMLRESVERIEWALRDVLPRAIDPPLGPPRRPAAAARRHDDEGSATA